ncbi:MAG: serine hydrolase domain-containing protein [Acidimicrobiia bacterium]
MTEIHGTCDERFAPVRAAFERNFEKGLDVGASAAVTIDGEFVVDIWAGHTDEDRTQPWERDTIINVWSTTKTMTALCALVLADRGELDFHSPVARYWPEFAAAGKAGVQVRHLMSHSAGLSGWNQPVTEADIYDWEKSTSMLAAQEPWWEPGTASGYHAITQGHLVGEVVRRITGQTLGQFFAAEIAGPLGADFHIGLPAEHDHRTARVFPPPALPIDLLPTDSIPFKTFTGPPLRAEASWEDAWRRAEIPAANGQGNARSVAAVQSLVACGGSLGGVTLLSPQGCDRIFEVQSVGTDLVLGVPVRYGMGYGIIGEEMPLGPSTKACFWGGWGGSIVIVDLENRMCVTYVMNRMGEGTLGDERGAGIVVGAYEAIAGVSR